MVSSLFLCFFSPLPMPRHFFSSLSVFPHFFTWQCLGACPILILCPSQFVFSFPPLSLLSFQCFSRTTFTFGFFQLSAFASLHPISPVGQSLLVIPVRPPALSSLPPHVTAAFFCKIRLFLVRLLFPHSLAFPLQSLILYVHEQCSRSSHFLTVHFPRRNSFVSCYSLDANTHTSFTGILNSRSSV